MLRPIRCRNCGERFYADVSHPGAECQNCTGDYDPTEQLKADAEVVKKATRRPKADKPQTIDPRNPDASKGS